MANEITYIPYGQDEISQQDLMTSLADGIESYLGSKRWAKKEKNRNAWLNAYLNIINSGLVGASNDKGYWEIQFNGDFDLSGLSDKEKEFYLDAAYYIQSKMSGITPKSQLEKESKEGKTKYDNKAFQEGLMQHISESRYGGRPKDEWILDWRDLDKDSLKDGIYGTAKRLAALAQYLRSYKDNLKADDYDFESGPYKSKEEWEARVNRALTALENPEWNLEDIDALNQLGIDRRVLFHTGADDPIQYTDPKTGEQREVTRLEYNELKRKLDEAAAAAKLKAEQLAQLKKIYDSTRFFQRMGTKWNGWNSKMLKEKYGDSNQLIAGLNSYFEKGIENLTPDEKSELHGAYKNLAKENIDTKLLNILKNNPRYKGSAPNRFKKIRGVDGFVYDSKLGEVLLIRNREQFNALKNQPLNLFSGVKTLEELALEANNRKIGKVEDWKTEDKLRMMAMALDIGGAVSAWVPGYGTAISGGLGATSLITNFIADANDDSVTKGEMWKNAGINLGLGIVGMVPGLGLASRSSKWLTTIAKWAPRLLTLQAIKDLPDSYNSLQKAINKPSELTNADWKNIAYGLSVVAGLSRGAAGYNNHRKFKPAFTESTEKQYTITTSKGKKTITLELVDKIKKLNPKDKEKYHEEVKKTLGLEKDETINTKDLEVFGKTLKSKGVKIEEEKVPSGLSPEAKAYRNYLENKNKLTILNHTILSKIFKTDYDLYKSNTLRSFLPEVGLSNKIKDIWNPLSDRNLQRKGIVVNKTPTKATNQSSSTQSSTKTVSNLRSRAEIRADWKNTIERKQFTDNKLKKGTESYSINNSVKPELGLHMTVNAKEDGSGVLNITRDINNTTIPITFKNLRELQERVAEFLKDMRKTTNTSKVKAGINHKEIGKILKDLKAKGWLKQGGQITTPLDVTIDNFFKNNNI